MKIIDGKEYYTAREVGMLVDRSYITIHLWDKWSKEEEKNGRERLIPSPIIVGKQNKRYWSKDDIEKIKKFRDNIQRGDLAKYTRRVWTFSYKNKFK